MKLDLADVFLTTRDADIYMDGSSFIQKGTRYMGIVVVTVQKEVIWAQVLLRGTSTQRAKLTALTQNLRWAEGKSVNVYTDSGMLYVMAHVHGQINKQRGLLTSEGKTIKNKYEVV